MKVTVEDQLRKINMELREIDKEKEIISVFEECDAVARR
jgi:hypothetical protein